MSQQLPVSASSPHSELVLGRGSEFLSASTIAGDEVCNKTGDTLGKIDDLMVDVDGGTIRYAVLTTGGFLGLGDRLFAIPWGALRIDREHKRFVLDVAVERFREAPGFDKKSWPDMADPDWLRTVDDYYGMPSEGHRV